MSLMLVSNASHTSPRRRGRTQVDASDEAASRPLSSLHCRVFHLASIKNDRGVLLRPLELWYDIHPKSLVGDGASELITTTSNQ